ncbi:hypothetical protein [Novosphingobium sp. MMS21-SN21R]|uniref:hypothetical protein n=1 Tax=Novosphingobium sp. MMS21-SN21R TaxID=2969298 RepID=UPI002888AB96|nr:hypothetical protein [Novosphingobium sp. MMS21-SN21R]MDT0508507.1 hypothetical protein [Novosphingobium sp. MMS21-SN21R]
MKLLLLRAVFAVSTIAIAAPAIADDPLDPSMRNSVARARDKEIIRKLNLAEAARVKERDERYAAQSRASNTAASDYASSRARYERDMAAWRRAVAACRAGHYAACAR